MCGIFGWQYRPNFRPNLQTRTLIADALARGNLARGKDSYGWFDTESGIIGRGMGEITGHTKPMAHGFSVLCHTRHATVGPKDLDNCHPFEFGSIVGAHNGGIHNHEMLNKARTEAKDSFLSCDSMHLIEAISRGLDNTSKTYGWGAVEWHDAKNRKTIRLCKLSLTADLCIAQTQHGIVWSSMKSHLEDALKGAAVKYILLEPKDNHIYDISSGCIVDSEETLFLGTPSETTKHTVFGSTQYHRNEFDYGDMYDYGSKKQVDLGFVQATHDRKASKHYSQWWENRIKEMKEKAQAEKEAKEFNLCADCYSFLDSKGKCPDGHKGTLVVETQK